MQVIHKFPIYGGQLDIDLPVNFRVLTVMEQNEVPTVWIALDPRAIRLEKIRISEIPTGLESFDELRCEYIGTIQTQKGLVWHYFHSRVQENV